MSAKTNAEVVIDFKVFTLSVFENNNYLNPCLNHYHHAYNLLVSYNIIINVIICNIDY